MQPLPVEREHTGDKVAFYDLVAEIEADAALKVVTFESANPDFFIAHYGTSGPRSRFGVPR